jgi:hypothetical protein
MQQQLAERQAALSAIQQEAAAAHAALADASRAQQLQAEVATLRGQCMQLADANTTLAAAAAEAAAARPPAPGGGGSGAPVEQLAAQLAAAEAAAASARQDQELLRSQAGELHAAVQAMEFEVAHGEEERQQLAASLARAEARVRELEAGGGGAPLLPATPAQQPQQQQQQQQRYYYDDPSGAEGAQEGAPAASGAELAAAVAEAAEAQQRSAAAQAEAAEATARAGRIEAEASGLRAALELEQEEHQRSRKQLARHVFLAGNGGAVLPTGVLGACAVGALGRSHAPGAGREGHSCSGRLHACCWSPPTPSRLEWAADMHLCCCACCRLKEQLLADQDDEEGARQLSVGWAPAGTWRLWWPPGLLHPTTPAAAAGYSAPPPPASLPLLSYTPCSPQHPCLNPLLFALLTCALPPAPAGKVAWQVEAAVAEAQREWRQREQGLRQQLDAAQAHAGDSQSWAAALAAKDEELAALRWVAGRP